MDNYLISRDRAQTYFLGFDQSTIIRTWGLECDDAFVYVDFLGRPYRVCRKTGSVFRQWDGQQAGYQEVLSIFDLMCHEGEYKYLSGQFAPVNSLKGRPRAVGVTTDFHSGAAGWYQISPEKFRRACSALGGEPIDMGDMGYQFPVFGELTVKLKFYYSDEDFPASVTLLWDENTLQFIFYETVFYIEGFLLKSLLELMK